jgi:hypothetical protein
MLHDGSAARPDALVKPTGEEELLWVADRLVESGALKPYNRFGRLGSGGLDLELVGTSLATFALPEFTVGSVLDLPVGKSIYRDSTLFVGGGYAYVYGNSSCLDGLTFGHVARARQIQAVGASDASSSANISESFFQLWILRGRSLISQATIARYFGSEVISTPLGKYSRTMRLRSSLLPRSHGLWGWAK